MLLRRAYIANNKEERKHNKISWKIPSTWVTGHYPWRKHISLNFIIINRFIITKPRIQCEHLLQVVEMGPTCAKLSSHARDEISGTRASN